MGSESDSINGSSNYHTSTLSSLAEEDSEAALQEYLDGLSAECYGGTRPAVSEGLQRVNLSQEYLEYFVGYCPRTFDGWACWNETKAGEIAAIPCPSFITGFSSYLKAHKECLEDGTWFRHPVSNRTWSNYTTCIDYEDLAKSENLVYIYQVGYGVSLIALIISFVIFSSFRSLQCTRVTIHKNLIISFIANNVIWIFWFFLQTHYYMPGDVNEVGCEILHIILHYFTIANYTWMFLEGFYLHGLIANPFMRGEVGLLKYFYAFGWIVPFILILAYTAIQTHLGYFFSQKSGKSCLQKNGGVVSDYILYIPMYLLLLVNFCFLLNILRVLLFKLNWSVRVANGQSAAALKKAVRATLILIPLFGINFVVLSIHPGDGATWDTIIDYARALTSSLQGLAVSILFCLSNDEVIKALKKTFEEC